MPAFGFDLGDTLLEYAGLPLSWVDHYADALRALAGALRVTPTSADIAAGCDVLRRYNTRLHPREHEVSFARILAELLPCLHAPAAPADVDVCAAAFFGVFRQRLRCFPDAPVTLGRLRAAGARNGIFTDVPYGMPRTLVLQDIAEAGLTGTFDALLTSGEAGYRKPAAETLRALAAALECTAAELAYVGNEEKDVAAARRFGCQAILLDRARRRPAWGQTHTITSLLELTEVHPSPASARAAVIRPITPADIPALFAVRVATDENRLTRAQLEALGIDEASVLQRLHGSFRGWLCECDGEVVGFAMGDHATGEMWVIAMLPAYTQRGLGSQLLRAVEDWLANEGHTEFWLTTGLDPRLRAYSFYRSRGWEDWKIEDGVRYMRKRRGAALAR